jgi:enoyl-CoA hydratase
LSNREAPNQVIAAIEKVAVAGGLELACWCDLRIAATDTAFGVYCRRWGIPLMDGGTVRLPRLIGHSHALDLIPTGRPVCGDEALHMGIVNRLVEPGQTLKTAVALAHEIATYPPAALRSDRRSSYEQRERQLPDALTREYLHGMAALHTGEAFEGIHQFGAGERHYAHIDTGGLGHS